jgi:glycosyltransferase 2 family protein
MTEPGQALKTRRKGSVVMMIATFAGIWLLIEQLAGFDNIDDVLKTAEWLWVLIALVLSQTILLTEAISLSGTAPIPLPIGPLALLRSATDFASLVGGTVARTATVVQFYQRHGLSSSVAVSSGVIYSIAGFLVQVVLAAIALVFTFDEFNFSSADTSGGSDGRILLTLLIIIVIVGAVVGILFAIPKVRRIIDSRVRPELASAWANLRSLATNPSKLIRIFGGQVLSQGLAALALGASLHAVGGSTSFGVLVVVCTASSFLGGLSPVPGGMGVMEAAYISGLTLAGVPEDIAIGATVLYRLVTAYLPPVWGWFSLAWLRRHEMA